MSEAQKWRCCKNLITADVQRFVKCSLNT